jgi:hypothetical protein
MTLSHADYVNGLSRIIHQDCKDVGWWDDPDRCLFTCLQLASTEVAEATEGDRKSLMDDHLPGFKMEEVELADCLIRILDLGGHLQLEYNDKFSINHRWNIATNSVGNQHLGINARIIDFANAIEDYQLHYRPVYEGVLKDAYGDLVKTIISTAMNRGYGFWDAVELKMEYNRKRADHKREARAGKHGKKY